MIKKAPIRMIDICGFLINCLKSRIFNNPGRERKLGMFPFKITVLGKKNDPLFIEIKP